MIIRTVDTLGDITDLALVSARLARDVTALTDLARGAIRRKAKLAGWSTCHCAVAVVHAVLRIVEAGPAGETLLAVGTARLTRIIALKSRQHDKVIELVHDEGLS